jgi:flagellar basal-body rod modification protein FlgD
MYSIRVVGNADDGRSVPVYTAVEGEVTGVDFTGSEPILQLGDVRVTLSSVMQIRSQDS